MYRDSVLPYSFDNEIVRVVRLGMTLQTMGLVHSIVLSVRVAAKSRSLVNGREGLGNLEASQA